jgi:hypothetical protein
MTRFAAVLAVSLLAARQPALAAGSTLDGLTSKATVAAGDTLPILAPGGNTLMKTTAANLAGFVLTSVKSFGAAGDGVTDDTAAIQAAISSGQSIYFPPGVYRTTATLNVTSPANDGQTLRGSASGGLPGALGASFANSAVIKPSSAVTVAIKIDGTPFPGGGYQLSWVQGFGIENLVIDMANMSDDASHVAINQIQAWDGHYNSVRVVNDGNNKRAWLFAAGAFTSSMQNVQGHILDFEGNSAAFGVTTIIVINCDCGRVISNYAGDLRFIGGAYQGADGSTKFYLRHSFDLWIQSDVEGTGTYMDVDASDNFLNDEAELQGCTCTLLSGSPGPNFRSWNQNQVNVGYETHLTQGSIQLNNNNTGLWNNRSQFLSGGVAQDQYIFQGRTAGESLWGVAGEANWWVGGVLAGDTVVGATAGSAKTWLMAGGVAGVSVDANGLTTYGTGTIRGGTLAASTLITAPTANIVFGGFGGQQTKPAVDGQIFSLLNAASGTFMLCNSAATIGNSFCSVGAGADWRGFSDAGFSVQTYDFDSATGNGTFTGTVTGIKFAGALNGSVGATTPSTGAFTTLTASSTIIATGVITASKGVVSTASTVAALPAYPEAGQSGFVTDSLTCTFGSPVTGGGSTKCPVVYTGASWVAG